jgi:hypothetical protein
MPTPRSFRRSLTRPRVLVLTALAISALAASAIAPAQAASLFSDGFESGTMSAWSTVTAAAGGVVGVQSTTVHSGTKAAQLSEAGTSGSIAYARTQLSGDQTDLTATGAFMVTTEGLASANVPIFRFLDATGARAVSLYRQNQSGNHLWVKVGNGSAAVTTGLLPLSTWGVLSLHTVVAGSSSTVAVTLNGATIYSTTAATLSSPMRSVQIGNDTGAQAFGIVVDDVQLANGGTSGDTTAPETTITGTPPSGTLTTGNASISFSSSETGSTFECSLDGSLYAACTSPTSYTSLPNGPHGFAVRAKDIAGNTDGSPATASWTVNVADTTPPDTLIVSGTSGTVATGDASFTFSSDDPAATFSCSLDATLPYTSCTSPKSYTGLANGDHTFSVRATDLAGNTDPTPALGTFTVAIPGGDSTPPETTITGGPTGTVTTADASFTFSSDDPAATFACSLDTAAFTTCSSPKSYTNQPNGSHTFRVQATDVAGNTDPTPDARSWNVNVSAPDTIPPVTTIDSGPTGTVATGNASFGFSSNEPGSTFACSLDGAPLLGCSGNPASYSGLANGTHTFSVQATDPAGNPDPNPPVRTWTVAVATGGGGTLTFPAVADSYVNSSSPSSNFGTAKTVISDTSPLEQSFYKFTVSGLSGTVTSAKLHVYAADATTNGPTVFATTSSWTETGLTWANKPATVGSASDDKGAVTLGTFIDYDVTPLVSADGTYSFTTVAQSSDGLSIASREATDTTQRPVLIITTSGSGGGDTTPPDTTITNAPSGTVTTGSASISFTSSEPGSAFNCSLDAAAYAPCISPATYTGLGNGLHSFSVRATDPAGNPDPTPATASWTVSIPASAPVNSVLPSISGATSQGSMLVADPGTWTNSPTGFLYQWRRCNATGASCVDIASATGTGYLTTATDVGSTLRVNVTASNAGGSATATSNATPKIVAATADPVIAAAGDIACDPHDTKFNAGNGTNSTCRQKATGALLGSLGNLSAILPLGDVQYDCSPVDEYAQSFTPAWGAYKSLIRPAAGNHEYRVNPDEFGLNDCSTTAAGYYAYFGAAAGDPTKGYYSYDIGTWHMIALNANCTFIPCKAASAQETWLKADLAAHHNMCTLAYYHQSRFSSGGSGNLSAYAPFWTDLYNGGADVVLSAHDHDYERFAPQDPAENADPTRGIREFIVGTGGRSHSGFQTIMPNSEVRDSTAYGVLTMTLHPSGYDFRFVPEAGKTFTDSGSGSCHA